MDNPGLQPPITPSPPVIPPPPLPVQPESPVITPPPNPTYKKAKKALPKLAVGTLVMALLIGGLFLGKNLLQEKQRPVEKKASYLCDMCMKDCTERTKDNPVPFDCDAACDDSCGGGGGDGAAGGSCPSTVQNDANSYHCGKDCWAPNGTSCPGWVNDCPTSSSSDYCTTPGSFTCVKDPWVAECVSAVELGCSGYYYKPIQRYNSTPELLQDPRCGTTTTETATGGNGEGGCVPSWGACSVACGGGIQTDNCGGTQTCNTQACPSLACVGLTKDKAAPSLGDQVTFTCEGALSSINPVAYFRWKVDTADFEEDPAVYPINPTTHKASKIGEVYTTGDWTWQCRVCTDNTKTTCTVWGEAN